MLGRIADLARIYGKLQLLHLRTHLEYEADFWIGIVGTLATQGAGFVFVWVLLNRVPAVKGWTLWEVAFLYGLSIIPRGMAELFCDGSWRLRFLVNTGELDRLLVRPISPALQVITQIASIHGFGGVILGGVILVRASQESHVVWSPAHALLLVATLLGSLVLVGSINFATNAIVFWDQSANSSFSFLMQNFAEFAKFPVTLYGRAVQIFLTWVLPFAFISYFPGAVILGKPEVPPLLGYCAPVVGLIVALIASLIWRQGLQRYQGAGH